MERITIEEIGNEAYYDVTINGDTWSVKSMKDALEMCEEILIKSREKNGK